MDQPDQMTEQGTRSKLASVLISIRLGVGAIVLVIALRTVVMLVRIPQFGELFRDLLEGTALPPLTQFYLGNSRLLLGMTALFAILAILALILSRKIWPIATGVAVILLSLVVSETASFAMMQPLAQIVSAMSGR